MQNHCLYKARNCRLDFSLFIQKFRLNECKLILKVVVKISFISLIHLYIVSLNQKFGTAGIA
jgi:hypothetical protein